MSFINIMLCVAFGIFAFLLLALIVGISTKEKVDDTSEK